MRKPVGKAVAVRKGNLVRIAMRLPRGIKTDARLSVWSALKGDEMSPHVQYATLETIIDGRPYMVKPMYVRLNEQKPRYALQFTADDNLTFRVMQEVDTKDEPLATVKVQGIGKVGQRARQLLQDIGRFLRRHTKSRIRNNPGRLKIL